MNDADLQNVSRKPPRDRAGFLNRLAIYLLGVAIGFLILGMFRAKSAAEARQREADRAARMGTVESSANSPTPAGKNP